MDCQQPPPQTTNLSINNNTRQVQLQWSPKNGRQPNAFVYRGQCGSARKCNKSNEKRSRTSFSQHQLRLLEDAFRQTNYPNQVYRDQLAADIELEPARVQIWFQNRRAKLKKQLASKSQSAACRHQVRVGYNFVDQQHVQAQSSSNLINQQQQLYLASINETALDLHLSSHNNNNNSLSSRSSSSDDLYPEPPVSCAYGGEFVSPISKLQVNIGTSGQQHQLELNEQGFYYSPAADSYAGPTVGEQQVYQQQQQQPDKMLHQIYLPRGPPPPHQSQLFSLQQSHQQEQQQQQDEVSEFSRMLNSELGRALYCATTNQQRQQPNRQVFYQQQAHHLGLEQAHVDHYVKY